MKCFRINKPLLGSFCFRKCSFSVTVMIQSYVASDRRALDVVTQSLTAAHPYIRCIGD